ncbi:mechanosensitive ion channel family protein [Sphingobium xanthum]|uniref:mechanosensitive ion channel family protein n=2 Tax=Sphingobium xanthum TaxID=1387165 RepID=UPI001FE488F7|nr:mechanosensitive ion channel domain-containing protein [Sphingobium xanthum]
MLQDPVTMMRDISHWFEVHWLQITVAIGVGIAIYLLLNFLRGLGKKLQQRDQAPGLLTVAGRTIRRTSHLFMVIVAARLVAGYASPPALLLTTIRFLFTVVAAIQVALWVREIIIGLIEQRTSQEGSETLANAMGIIRILVSVALFAVAAIVVLDNLGVNVTGLVAGLGIGGIAIGLAAQGIFSDLFAALSILFDKPFRQGETINFGTNTATVERIGLKSTRLRAVTGERLIVSNAQLLDKEIISYAELAHRRVKFAIGVTYQTAPDAADALPELLRQIVEAHGGEYVRGGFIGFGASSLDFELEFDIMSGDWDVVYQARHQVGLAILRQFNERGLEFAYPTQTTFTAAPDGRMIMPYPTPTARAKSSGQATSA